MLSYDFQLGWMSNFPAWPLLTPDGERCSFLLPSSRSPTSPLDLHWDPLVYSLPKVGVCTPHSAFTGMGSCRSLVTFEVVVVCLFVCLFFLWCLAGVECLFFKIFLAKLPFPGPLNKEKRLLLWLFCPHILTFWVASFFLSRSEITEVKRKSRKVITIYSLGPKVSN